LVRARLVDRLEAGVDRRLTVVTAPAGSGKSVLVDQWLARHRRARVACVAFQPGDDPRRAAARLTAGLSSLGGDPFSVTPAGRGPTEVALGRRFVDRLAGGLAAVGRAILVLDGIDAPSDPVVATELAGLVDRVPGNVNLVVTRRGRDAAGCPGGDGGRPTHLEARDLAFTPEETWLLVREASGRELSDRQLGQVLRRTEGWAPGIVLAAVGLRATSDVGAHLAHFSGQDPDVAAFLRDEVLAREAPEVRRFLTRTSVLHALSGPLCDAITGGDDGDAQLRGLEARGVFTNRRGSGEGFSYHRMFRDFLRHQLRVAEPETERVLLGRAGAWHAARGMPEVAVRYHIEARSWPSVVALVDRCGPARLNAGRASDLARWLEAVPGSGDPTDIELALTTAGLRTAVGSFARAADLVHQLERRELSLGQDIAVEVLRATWSCFGHAGAPALAALEAARTRLESVEPAQRPCTLGVASPRALATSAAILRSRDAWFRGHVGAARRDLSPLARPHPRCAPERVHATSTLALLEAWAGNLTTAQRLADRVVAIARHAGLLLHPATVDGRLAAAHVLRQRGDLHDAGLALAEAYDVLAASGPPTCYPPYALEQAHLHRASGQPRHGLAVIGRCRESVGDPLPPTVASCLAALEVHLLVATGHPDRAESVLAGAAPATTGELAAASVHCAVARGDLETARARLAGWCLGDGEPVGRLQHALWHSIVEFEAGNRRLALERALDLVQLAEPEGHLERFLECGRPAERLFRALYHTLPTPYVRRVIQAAQVSSQTAGPTVLGLSRRELEVVRYLPTPLSSGEIAARLYISLNTLKTHLQAIYGKLGVTGRRDAIRQAQRLGLA
jgi:LuxR family maltose regulon positive regulatory protein